MKCYKNHFGLIVSQMLAILMGLFMGVAILIIEGTPITWVSLYTKWGQITLTVLFLLMVIPVSEIGNKSAEKVGCKPGTIVFTLVANIIPTFIINTVLAAVVPALGIFYNDAIPKDARMGIWIGTFFGGWLLTFVISFFLALVAAKIGEIVAVKSIGIPGQPEQK